MRQVQASAPTREEAINKALAELGVEMYEVDDIKVLDEGSRGLFGLGARPVKVQVTITKDLERPARQDNRQDNRGGQRERTAEKPREERKEQSGEAPKPREQRERGSRGGRNRNDRNKEGGERPAQPPREKQNNERNDRTPRAERPRDDSRSGNRDQARNEQRPPREDRPPREERPRAERPPREERAPRPAPAEDKAAFAQISDEQGAQAAALLSTIIEKMDIEAQVAFQRDPEGAARIEVKSPHGALLIGRKGTTLGAMQYLVNRMISQTDDGESLERVVVDVEGYLDRRRESLQELAREMAAKAVETGRSMRLKPMSPQERRIIHVTLQEDTNVRTYSQGEALYRSVVISPAAEVAVAIKRPSASSSQGGDTPRSGSRGGVRSNRRVRPRPKPHSRDTEVDAGAFGD